MFFNSRFYESADDELRLYVAFEQYYFGRKKWRTAYCENSYAQRKPMKYTVKVSTKQPVEASENDAEYLIIHRDIVDMIEEYLTRRDVGYLRQALEIELSCDVQRQRRNVIFREMEEDKRRD